MTLRSSTPQILESPAASSPSPLLDGASRRLLTAVIRRAVLDYALHRRADKDKDPHNYKLALDAGGWLFLDSAETLDGDGRYTFRYICELLELDPVAIREQAKRLTRDDLQRFNGRDD